MQGCLEPQVRLEENLGGAKFPPTAIPCSMNATALVYTSRTLLMLQCTHRPTGNTTQRMKIRSWIPLPPKPIHGSC